MTATRDREGAFEASSPCAEAQGENGKAPPPDPRVRPLWEGTAAKHQRVSLRVDEDPRTRAPWFHGLFGPCLLHPRPSPGSQSPQRKAEKRGVGKAEPSQPPVRERTAKSGRETAPSHASLGPRSEERSLHHVPRGRLCQRRAEGRQFMAPYLLTSRTSKQNPDLRAVASRNTAPCPGGPACPS